MIAFLVCIGMIFAGLIISDAKTSHNSVIDKIEASNFDESVVADCIQKANDRGYLVTVDKEINVSSVQHYKVVLYYDLVMPLFGKVHTGKLVGYAYPGASFFEKAGTADHYFEIDEDGVLGIKAAYRWVTNNTNYASDNGSDQAGSKNHLLPSEIVIPTYFDGVKVVKLRDDMFAGNATLTKISFEEGVQVIGNNAFKNCTNLTGDVTAANSIVDIESHAFENCGKLTSLKFNETSVLETVGDYAFKNCAEFTDVTLPDSLEENGFGAFEGCTNMTSFQAPFVGASTTASKNSGGYIGYIFGAEDHTSHNTTVPPGLSSVTITKYVTYYSCYDMDQLTNLQIGADVTSFGPYPFARCDGLTSVVIPKSVTETDAAAFYYCSNLTKVEFETGSQLVTMGPSNFAYCKKLASIKVPNTVKTIGNYCFEECDKLSFQEASTGKLPDGVETIGIGAYSYCDSSDFTSFYIPASVKSIDYSLLTKSQYVTKVQVASGNTAYKAGSKGELLTYDGTKIVQYPYAASTSYTVPATVTTIGQAAFSHSEKLQTLKFEAQNKLITIEDNAFSHCSDISNSITLPTSVTKIGNYAFYHSGTWAEFRIGPAVTEIGKSAFYDAGGIGSKTYLLMTTAPTIGDGAFDCNTNTGDTIVKYYVYVKNDTVKSAFVNNTNYRSTYCDVIVDSTIS